MYHLAQLNIARALAPMDDPIMEGFASRLDEINALAEASPGYVWRLQDESGNATSFTPFDDPMMLVNLTLWESVEALRSYSYETEHAQVMRGRKSWFERPDGPHLVLWWIPAGTLPTIEDAIHRLKLLELHGPTAEAFTFREAFPPPT